MLAMSPRGLMSVNFEQTVTAQLCSRAISPKVVRDLCNPSFAQTCPNINAPCE